MKVRVKLVVVFNYGNSGPKRVECFIPQRYKSFIQVCVPPGDCSPEKVSDIISAPPCCYVNFLEHFFLPSASFCPLFYLSCPELVSRVENCEVGNFQTFKAWN